MDVLGIHDSDNGAQFQVVLQRFVNKECLRNRRRVCQSGSLYDNVVKLSTSFQQLVEDANQVSANCTA